MTRRAWRALYRMTGRAVFTAVGAATIQSAVSTVARGQDATEGKRVFETLCLACHTVGGGVKIGPDLQGVTERRDAAWLRKQITDPAGLKRSGDSVALANQAKYGVPMPPLGLKEAQVDAVLAHLGVAESAPASRPALFVPSLALAAILATGITILALGVATRNSEIRA
ncbi:MAG: cytochrome c [Gemmatimonadaceae bacterium]|nr:cytochrome c [Gemmatimonadaceae bacterium]